MSPLKIFLLMLLIFSVSACGSGDDLIAHEQKIYSVLIDYWDVSKQHPAWIRSSSLSFNDKEQDENIERFKDKISDLNSIRASFNSINTIPSTLPLPSSDKITIFTESEYKKIFDAKEKSLDSRWHMFYRKNPQVHGFINVSRVGFDKTLTKALVYYAVSCGRHCGNGYMVLFERGFFGWKLVWLEHLWVS
ncbi:MAG: hypothetical protein V4812_18610 [Pseudomonadota bacterium]